MTFVRPPVDLVYTQCGWHICPRCGSCSSRCHARELRREQRKFGVYRESRVLFVPKEEWIRRRKEQIETVGRPIDYEP